MRTPPKKLKVITGDKKKPMTIGFFCLTCAKDSAYATGVIPYACIRCGFLYVKKTFK